MKFTSRQATGSAEYADFKLTGKFKIFALEMGGQKLPIRISRAVGRRKNFTSSAANSVCEGENRTDGVAMVKLTAFRLTFLLVSLDIFKERLAQPYKMRWSTSQKSEIKMEINA